MQKKNKLSHRIGVLLHALQGGGDFRPVGGSTWAKKKTAELTGRLVNGPAYSAGERLQWTDRETGGGVQMEQLSDDPGAVAALADQPGHGDLHVGARAQVHVDRTRLLRTRRQTVKPIRVSSASASTPFLVCVWSMFHNYSAAHSAVRRWAKQFDKLHQRLAVVQNDWTPVRQWS